MYLKNNISIRELTESTGSETNITITNKLLGKTVEACKSDDRFNHVVNDDTISWLYIFYQRRTSNLYFDSSFKRLRIVYRAADHMGR